MDMEVTGPCKRIYALVEKSRFLDACELAVSDHLFDSADSPERCLLACRLGYHLGDMRRTRVRSYLGQKRYPENLALAVYWASYLEDTAGTYYALQYLKSRQQSRPSETPADVQADALSLQAMLLATLRDETAAMDVVGKARSLMPDDPWHLVCEARVLKMLDKYDAATLTCRRAVKLFPDYRPARQMLSNSLLLAGERAEALQLLQSANDSYQSWLVAYDLADLALEEGDYELTNRALQDINRFAPLADKSVRDYRRRIEVELEIQTGNYSVAASLAREMEGLYYRHLAERLEAVQPWTSSGRKLIPLNFTRQHHNTCAPAVLSSLTDYWGRPFPMDQIVDDIWYGGTFDFQERRWGEEHDWHVREFRLDWKTACTLVERAVPFGLSSINAGAGHLQAVIGVDHVRETLLIRDPYDPGSSEILQKEFFEQQVVFGPRAILLLPKSRVTDIDDIELPEADAYDRIHAFQIALDGHDRVMAMSVVDDMQSANDPERLVLLARRRLAVYDRNEYAFLQAVESLLDMYPNDSTLLIDKQGSLHNLGHSLPRIDWLREVTSRDEVHPRLILSLASALIGNVSYRSEVCALLRKTRVLLATDADWHSVMGQYCWKEHDFDNGLGHFRVASNLEPAVEQYVRNYVSASGERGCLDNTLGFLKRRYRRLGSRSSAPTIALLQALDEANHIEAAVRLLHEALQATPDDGDLLLYGVRYLQGINKLDESAGMLRRSQGLVSRADWLRAAARQAEYAGDRPQAMAYSQELVELDPLDNQAMEYIANYLLATQGSQQALEYLGQQSDRNPAHPPLTELYAGFLEAAGEHQRAMDVVRRRLETAPDDVWSLRELARLAAQSGDNSAGLEFCNKALAVDPLDARTHEQRGWLCRRTGDLETTWAACIQAVRLDIDCDFAVRELLRLETTYPHSQQVSQLLIDELRLQVIEGNSLLAFQDEGCRVIKDAILRKTLEEALDARPDLWAAWSALIIHLLHMDLPNEALAIARKYADQYPGLPRVWLDLAHVYRQLHDEREEINALNKAQELNPRWLEPIKRLADLAEKRADWATYRRLITDALAYSPREGVLWGYLSTVEEAETDADGAIHSLEQAVTLDRDYDWAWQQLDRLYRARGTPERLQERLLGNCDSFSGETGVYQRAACYADDRQAAQSLLHKARELDMLNVDCHVQVIRNLIGIEQYDQACSEIHHPIWEGVTPAAIQAMEADILRARNKLNEARAVLAQVLDDAPDLLSGWKQLMDWSESDNDQDNYRKALQNLSRLVPTDAEYPARLAELLLLDDRQEEARAVLAKSFAMHPDDNYTALTWFDFLADAGELEQAETVLEVCLQRFPWSITYARAIRLAVQQEDDAQAKSCFDCLLKNEQTEEWSLKTAVCWLSKQMSAATILSRIEYEMEQGPAQHMTASLGRAWGSLLPSDGSDEHVIERLGKFADMAANRGEFLYGFLDGICETRILRKQLLLWMRDTYREQIASDDALWANMIYAMHDNSLENEAIVLGEDWRARKQVPEFGYYNLAICMAVKKRWKACIEVAEFGIERIGAEAAPLLQLVLAAYGYVCGRNDLFEDYSPLLEESQLGHLQHFRVCQLTMQYQSDINRPQYLGLEQYLKMLNSYDKVGLSVEGVAELATAHCLEMLKDRSMSLITRWFCRFRERRLERWFRYKV
ncbi:MAG: hypothetical protein ABFS22_01880 [Pseudomonadota bacterium]